MSKIKDRPDEMLMRQMLANRKAARLQYKPNDRSSHAHLMPYRSHFVKEILKMRKELRRRGLPINKQEQGNGNDEQASCDDQSGKGCFAAIGDTGRRRG